MPLGNAARSPNSRLSFKKISHTTAKGIIYASMIYIYPNHVPEKKEKISSQLFNIIKHYACPPSHGPSTICATFIFGACNKGDGLSVDEGSGGGPPPGLDGLLLLERNGRCGEAVLLPTLKGGVGPDGGGGAPLLLPLVMWTSTAGGPCDVPGPERRGE